MQTDIFCSRLYIFSQRKPLAAELHNIEFAEYLRRYIPAYASQFYTLGMR